MQIVTVSSKGQVVIPSDVRNKLGITEGTRLVMDVSETRITLSTNTSGWKSLAGAAEGTDLIGALMEEKQRERKAGR